MPGADRVQWTAAYGLTETTVTSTLYHVDPTKGLPTTPLVPIGRPIPGVEAWVLSDQLEPVALGEAGQLYIGGSGLVTEYVNDPRLTAQKFRSVSLPDGRCLRLFETGDRACWLPDGNLAFLGRTDDQLKWHGFRIEPGEIETVLLGHPEVREAAVVLNEQAGESNLVACVVLQARAEVTSSTLHAYLRQRLPVAKIPAHIIVQEQLSRTPSGKIDRRALSHDEGVVACFAGTTR